jgi:hypothetical protein
VEYKAQASKGWKVSGEDGRKRRRRGGEEEEAEKEVEGERRDGYVCL